MVAPLKNLPEKKTHSLQSFLDELLAEQQQLQTPVARFSEHHERNAAPALAPVYRDLIPLSAPRAGEQYAFEVDLDACTGCKACVAACHSLNGLDENETWRDVGLLLGGTRSAPYQQTVTTACHHCADPACLNGCPVLAYEKDPVTGIVRHLDDQCIGCQYCVLKCPYDVPKYNERLGIVRKCDMCHGRLAEGEAPACVQACPTSAISIVTVQTFANGERRVDTSTFLAGAPDPSYTQPTTRYVTSKVAPAGVVAGDASAILPQPAHWPLVVMLTLLPASLGIYGAEIALSLPPGIAVIALTLAAAGLTASVFHLGKPLRAWRVFLGLRTSWLSREAVLFGLWFGLASAHTLERFVQLPFAGTVSPLLASGCLAVGALSLFCSVMIYVDTHRQFWRLGQTAPRFFGTACVVGLATAFVLRPSVAFGSALAAAALLKLAIETRVFRALDCDDDDALEPATKTARLLSGPLRSATSFRYLALLIGGVALPGLIAGGALSADYLWVIPALVLCGEFAERYLFFRAVVAFKMPGVPQ